MPRSCCCRLVWPGGLEVIVSQAGVAWWVGSHFENSPKQGLSHGKLPGKVSGNFIEKENVLPGQSANTGKRKNSQLSLKQSVKLVSVGSWPATTTRHKLETFS